MTHEELRDRLLDLAYGELSPGDARGVEEHAAGCEACRAELAAIRGTRRVMAALPVEAAPEQGERVLVAAAREAVRARPQRRTWRRWLWAAPVLASLAVVVLFSLRLGAVRPPSAAHEDRGDATYAVAAKPAAPGAELEPAPPAAQAAGSAPRAPAGRGEPAREAASKAEAPAGRNADQARLATAPQPPSLPPRAGAPIADRDRSVSSDAAAAPEAPVEARAAPSPSPAVAAAPVPSAPPPSSVAAPSAALRGPSGGAAADLGEREGVASALPPTAPGEAMGRPGLGATPEPGPLDGEARREAAPPRRAAKAMAAPDVSGAGAVQSPRARAIAAATARARRLGVDPRGMAIGVEGPTTLDAWIAQYVAVAAPAELEGRRFWAVAFTPAAPRSRPALTVFVEDGSFLPLAELRGK